MKLIFLGMMIVVSFSFTACGGGGGNSPSPPPPSTNNQWTWMGGANSVDQAGTYGTLGTPSASNIPGARLGAVSWKDASGNFWLFGGLEQGDLLNDLWKYSGGEWTWMSGANVGNQAGTYGTLGTPDPNNVPGARTQGVGWIDGSGNLWLFGGYGYDSTASYGLLNDLWEYSAGQWTWMGGSNLWGEGGTYGTQGTPAPDNIPGARGNAVTWTDASGDFWLMGGSGNGATSEGYLNDLWRYSAGEWTWMGGSTGGNGPATYGSKGTPAPGNTPGGRYGAASWKDQTGNMWLFGGYGMDSTNTQGYLNDLWKYSGGQWAWMSGSEFVNQPGSYGTEGVASASNVPGARDYGAVWTDASGNLWLLGGEYLDGMTDHLFNDLWKYSAGEWTWVSGASIFDQKGHYGTQGTSSSTNVPGARELSGRWIDASGNLWLFGGGGYDSNGNPGRLNDLWRYKP